MEAIEANLSRVPSLDDWAVLVGHRQNMLLVGSQGAMDHWLAGAAMSLCRPIHRIACERGLTRPPVGKTLLLDNVDALGTQEQARLLRWLDDPGHPLTQVISFTRSSLYPLVQAGVFHADLYYRLNVLYFEIFPS